MRVASLQSASTGGGAREVAVLLELAADLEQVVLGVVDQHEPRGRTRAIWRHSSAPIEPPAPVTSTTSSAQVGAHAVDLHAHGLAAEHVLHLDLAHLAHQVRRRRESSSKTVGSVRTGMSRSRQAVTTLWRSVPGADGIAMITSSGSASSRTRGSSSVVPSTLQAGHAHALLARVVVDEADRRRAQAGVAAQLEGHLLAAVAGAHDQHLARPRARAAGRAARARPRRARGSATPVMNASVSRKSSAITPRGGSVRSATAGRGPRSAPRWPPPPP